MANAMSLTEQDGCAEVRKGGILKFFISDKCNLGKIRTGLWLGSMIVMFAIITAAQGKGAMLVMLLIVNAIILLPIHLTISRYLRRDKPAVTLTDDALSSFLFIGKTDHIALDEVEAVAFTQDNGIPYFVIPYLVFTLSPSTDAARTKSERAMLRLDVLAPEDRGKLMDAVTARLGKEISDRPVPSTRVRDEAQEEREFNERIVAFAPKTWATSTLIALNVAVLLVMTASGTGFLQIPPAMLLQWGGNAASEVQHGEWWRLLSAIFLHGGIVHLTVNMLALYSIGTTVERIYGRKPYLLIYFGAGLLGSALSLHYSAQDAVSVGASGAIFGITGALLVAYVQHWDKLPEAPTKKMISSILFFIGYSLLNGLGHQGIDNAAHIGGLIGGGILAYILPERFDMGEYKKTFFSRSAAALAIMVCIVTGTAASAPKATIDQHRVLLSREPLMRAVKNFDDVMKEIQQVSADLSSGKLSEREADEKSRNIFAPRFRAIKDDLDQVLLHPNDPRADFVQTIRRMTEIFIEMNSMESVYDKGSAKPLPAYPKRMAQLESELNNLANQLQTQAEMLNKKGSTRIHVG
ncbi:MAG: rhomboid family intramembrane serine protease [Gammaproteobacteria bacterium]|nr:rhomboid family intramembrane serine protease [Gammaproteobacteria bacterium]